MPHLIIEYTSNLNDRIDIDRFVKALHKVAAEMPELPMEGLRTRAIELTRYRVADGDPENAFVHVVLRLRPGRAPEVKRSIGDRLFAAVTEHLAPAYASSPVGITMELQDIDVEYRYLKSNLGEYVKKRMLAATEG
jgi:5-carboxymethyl-2-hydroxymuconate isomerase